MPELIVGKMGNWGLQFNQLCSDDARHDNAWVTWRSVGSDTIGLCGVPSC